MKINNILVCPKCHGKLALQKSIYHCRTCSNVYSTQHGIPIFILTHMLPRLLKKSQSAYDQIHQQPWDRLRDGSYEILATFAQGNKTLDVACGDGFIEELAPQTVGVDFSHAALLKAKKRGAKYLVQAVAEYLPFKDDSFDVVICSGSLEHFADPQQAIYEMVRVSRIQILTVHKSVLGHDLITHVLQVRHQPIERPINLSRLESMLVNAHAHIVFKGVWTLPVNYGRVIKWLPELKFLPSSSFVISIKKP